MSIQPIAVALPNESDTSAAHATAADASVLRARGEGGGRSETDEANQSAQQPDSAPTARQGAAQKGILNMTKHVHPHTRQLRTLLFQSGSSQSDSSPSFVRLMKRLFSSKSPSRTTSLSRNESDASSAHAKAAGTSGVADTFCSSRGSASCGKRSPWTHTRQLRISAALTACSAAFCATLLIGATTLASPPAQARAITHNLNIPAQDLGEALKALSAAADEQLLFSKDVVSGKHSTEVRGEYSTDEALAILLKGSGLKADRTPSGVLLIRTPTSTTSTSFLSSSAHATAADGSSQSAKQSDSSYYGSADKSSSPGSQPKSLWTRLALALTQNESQSGSSQSDTTSSSEKSSSDKRVMEEVIVTAQKREERLQDVPVSISVLSGDDLDRSTDMGLNSALRLLPGVSVIDRGARPSIAVRGVTSLPNLMAGTNPIAFYLDSVPFGFSKDATIPNPDTYDLERVEVLRGPQGTLYGANALNGVVRVLTKDADPDAFEFKARASASSTEIGGENYRGDAVVNVPIVDGKFAARAVLGYQDWSGWIDRPTKKDVNDAERSTMRLKLNAQPTDQLSVRLSAEIMQAEYGAASTGFDNGDNSIPSDEPIPVADYDVYGLRIGYDFPSFSIASTTSYLKFDTESHVDTRDIGLLGFFFDLALSADTFAQEVNLTSTQGESWRWSAGGIYRDSSDTILQDLPGLIAAPISEENDSKSYAVFGELTRLFLDGQWELTGGLRYFEDDVAFRETSRADATPPSGLVVADTKFSATTTRFALAWHPTEQLTAYGTYGEGFRSGAHQNSEAISSGVIFPPLRPDKLTNYELGAKGSLWSGRLNFDAALYYIDWQDIQLRVVVPAPGFGFNVNVLANGDTASGLGVDLTLRAQPTDRLQIGVNASWSDLTLDSDVISRGRVLFKKGDRVGQSPEYTAGVSADYVFPLGSGGFEGRFSTSANYNSKLTQIQLQGPTRIELDSDSIWISRASASVLAPANWTATLFVDNLNNEKGVVAPSSNADRRLRLRPRTIGVQLDYRF